MTFDADPKWIWIGFSAFWEKVGQSVVDTIIKLHQSTPDEIEIVIIVIGLLFSGVMAVFGIRRWRDPFH